MGKHCSLLGLSLMVFVASWGIRAGLAQTEQQVRKFIVPGIDRLATMSDAELEVILRDFDKSLSETEYESILQFERAKVAKNDKATYSSAYILGTLRSWRAAERLARSVELENKSSSPTHRLPRWDRYPVAEALIRIGVPAIPHMIRNIKKSPDAKIRQASARVIRFAENKDVAVFRLQHEIKVTQDLEAIKRLEEAIRYIQAFPNRSGDTDWES